MPGKVIRICDKSLEEIEDIRKYIDDIQLANNLPKCNYTDSQIILLALMDYLSEYRN